MKLNKRVLFVLFLMFAVTSVFAQLSVERASADVIKEEIKNKPYSIDARPFLERTENKAREFYRDNPDFKLNQTGLKKAFSFNVGDSKLWWALNNSTDEFYQVSSTCKAVGTNCYVFVEDSLWNVQINQTQVNAIVNGFDNTTPANVSKGVFNTDVDTFGDPPNIDGDAKVIILILNIIDDYEPGVNNSYVAGYFHGYNEAPDTYSNEAEMFYIDANPADLLGEDGLTDALNTVAHEFQHMIHWNADYVNGLTGDNREYSFINEGCSEIASYICGYGFRSQSLYSNATNGALLNWNSTLTDYSRAARFMLYMHEQFGPGFLRALVQEKKTGGSGIDAAVKTVGGTLTYKEIIQNFHIANAVNDKSVDSKYGYDLETIQPVNFTEFYSPVQSGTVNIDKFGASYLSFKDGKNLTANISLNPAEASYNSYYVKADVIKIGSTVTVEKGMATGADVNFEGFGTDYNELIFIVRSELNIGGSVTDLNIDYTTTGETEGGILELAYDDARALGSLGFASGDIMMVTFNGVSNASLDSIKIAVRNVGSLNAEIWEFTGVGPSIGFGNKMADVTAVSTKEAVKINDQWQDPFENWVNIDLTSSELSASTNFAVKIPYVETPWIMVTTNPNTVTNHSFTYINEDSKWYTYTRTGTTDVWTYMVRAYVSFTTGTGDREVVELTPATFNLEQNYPNPFNPSTTINYTIPEAANVKLEVFDIKGEKIAELVNDFQNAGNYHATWNGKSFSGAKAASGIYFYRVTAGNVVESKKMMLLK